jgi:phage tail sheath protein FI
VDDDVVGPDAANIFNLSVRDGSTGQIEVLRNVSVLPGHVRQVDKVLLNESQLVQMTGVLPASKPAAHPDLAAGETDIWADNATATNAKVASSAMASDGGHLDNNDFTGSGKENAKTGLYALKKADLFNILCIPPYLATGNVDTALVGTAAAYCEQSRAVLLVDPPTTWTDKDKAKAGVSTIGTSSKNAALFFPRLKQPNPLRGNQIEEFAPSGSVAGIFSRTDTQRGVWKAPAGLEATLVGVPQLSVPLTDPENGELNPLGVNCLRAMPAAGRVVWGARTLQGDDRLASEWKYIPVRRTALFIEESLYRGTQWVVFEPNDEPLWAQIRLNIGAFMQNLFRQGAFQGKTPAEAYFVKCDKETTTQTDINLGIVNIVVGFAPLKPAEFVIIKLQQMAGQIAA